LEEKELKNNMAVAKTLGHIKSEISVLLLMDLANTKESKVRSSVAKALADIESNKEQQNLSKELSRNIVSLAQRKVKSLSDTPLSKNEELQNWYKVLSTHGNGEAIKTLEEITKRGTYNELRIAGYILSNYPHLVVE